MVPFPNTLTTSLPTILEAKEYLVGGQYLLEDEPMKKRKFLQ
jgi:hypothetical protein